LDGKGLDAMKQFLLIAFLTFLATVASGYIALEDFQSFEDGQDIGDSPDWTDLTLLDEIHCADLGGGVKVAVVYPEGHGYNSGYLWEASDAALDYGLSADFSYGAEADDPAVILIARYNGVFPIDFEFYWCAVRPANSWIYLGYMDIYGLEVIWDMELDEQLQPDEWYNFKFYVYDEDPVTFEIYFEGEELYTYVETSYIIPEGPAALGCASIFDVDDICVDNVTQWGPAPGEFALLTPEDGETIYVFDGKWEGSRYAAKTLSVGGNKNLAAATLNDRTEDPVDVDVEFTWEESEFAEEYQLTVDDDDDFSSPEVDVTGITEESYTETFTVTESITYYWRVIASYEEGGETVCDEDFSFEFDYNNVNVAPVSLGHTKSAFR
jgi:hypothetical protein